MGKKLKLLLIALFLVLVTGIGIAKWTVETTDDVNVNISSCKPFSIIKTFDDLTMNTSLSNSTNSTTFIVDIDCSLHKVNVSITEEVNDLTGGECDNSGDCTSTVVFNDNSTLQDGYCINMTDGDNIFNYTISCKQFSCQTHRVTTLNLTEV